MKVLLHICCAPCAIYPLEALRREEMEVMGYFYRNNIHPFTECLKRQSSLEQYAGTADLKVVYQADYDLEGFLRLMAFRESDRCRICYYERLRAAAHIARRGKFDGFTTTLLYSRFQKHDTIRSVGESLGRELGVPFLYRDFRPGWKEGIESSKRLNLYRQNYCGCIYSEKERFYRP